MMIRLLNKANNQLVIFSGENTHAISKCFIVLMVCFIQPFASFSQNTITYKWWNPASSSFPVIEGQAWSGEVKNPYDRFPARAA